MDPKKLAIITSHPIQYYAPVFRLLHQQSEIEVKVIYTWGITAAEKKYDPGFGQSIQWDIPLLNGYPYAFADNTSKTPGTHHFRGIITPGLPGKIESWGADAILVYGWNYQGHLQVMRHFKGKIPVYFRGDSNLLGERSGIKKLGRRIFLKWVYRFVDKAFYVGACNRDYFLAHGLMEDQLIFAPHAIDNQFYDDNLKNKYAEKAKVWREELNYNHEDIVILFAGKLDPQKDPLLLLNAVQEVNESGINPLKLAFVGSGQQEDTLRKEAGNDPNIRFLGFQNQGNMPVVYRLGDLFVLPSQGETWGLGINEAMACGRAVVGSSLTGCSIDLIEEGKNGFVFKAKDHKALIEKLTRVRSRDQLLEMGKRSREIITKWSIEQQVKAIASEICG